MHTIFRFGLVLGLAVSGATAAPRLKDPPAKERASIVGEWVQDHGGRWHEFTAGGEVRVGDVAGPRTTRYATDGQTSPAGLDLTHRDKKATWHGIYKIEGNTLTICLSLHAGEPRPTSFERSDDPPVSLQTYTRVKPKH